MGAIFPVNILLYSQKDTAVAPPFTTFLRSSIGLIKIQPGKKFLIRKIYHEATYSGLFTRFLLDSQPPSFEALDVRNNLSLYNVDENVFKESSSAGIGLWDFGNDLQSILYYNQIFVPSVPLNQLFSRLDKLNFKDRPLRVAEMQSAQYIEVTNALQANTNILNVNNIQMTNLEIPFESNKDYILIFPRASSKYRSAFYPPTIPYTRSEICISHLYFEIEQLN